MSTARYVVLRVTPSSTSSKFYFLVEAASAQVPKSPPRMLEFVPNISDDREFYLTREGDTLEVTLYNEADREALDIQNITLRDMLRA
jgi:hypothetical protein